MDVGKEDMDSFEKMIVDIKGGYGSEDYEEMRKIKKKEEMYYMEEEIGEIE